MSIATICKSVLAISLSVALGFAAGETKTGKAALKSAGPLAFGPNGVLFVGDSMGAAIFALETGDTKAAKASGTLEIKGVTEKIAALLGTTADQIRIEDVVVNPASKNLYMSVTRGRGPEAAALILKADTSGKLSEFSLENIKHATVELPAAPAADAKDRRGNSMRLEAITDLAYVNGNLIIAGLSNEEFSSSLRSIPYPFKAADKPAGIEIYHGAHGRFETNAPVRTFVPYTIANQQHILAAYTCTPLVKIPMSELKPGNKVKGTTIAELGSGNRPLDMIVYRKDGKDFILMANSSRGVMKLPAEKLDSYQAITEKTEKQGVPYETIASLKGVQQLDKLDDANAITLVNDGGSIDIRSIPLP